MKKLVTIIAIISIAIISIAMISCNKTVDQSVKNDVQMKTSTQNPLDDYYVFSSLDEVLIMFQYNGYSLNDIQTIKTELNNYEETEGISFSKFELELFKEGSYNFVSTSLNDEFKVSYILENDLETYRMVGSSCTCTGCPDGCSPRRKKNGDCLCTICEFVGSGVKCTKSESLSAGTGN